MPENEKITLYYKEGSSDKVYSCSLESSGEGWIVPFAYGRRGSTMKPGVKTKAPLPYEKAKKIYDALVREKTGEGYTAGADGTPFVGTPGAKTVSGLLPQLLTKIGEGDLEKYFKNPRMVIQEKFDGERRLIRFDNGKVTGINKKGLECGFPESIEYDIKTLAKLAGWSEFVLDGEQIGDRLYVFDILSENGRDLKCTTYQTRLGMLMGLKFVEVKNVSSAMTERDEVLKRSIYSSLKKNKKEGVVFKDLDAPYKAGRPDSGGPQVKFKFWESATCKVLKANGEKRSVFLTLFDGNGDGWVDVGKCTIPANHAIPEADSIVEIKYLYAYKGGSLYQPIYLGKRADQGEEDCLLSQLKFKASGATDEDDE